MPIVKDFLIFETDIYHLQNDIYLIQTINSI